MAKRRKRARHKVRAHRRRGTTVKTHMSYEEAGRRRRRGKRRRRARAAEAPRRRKRRKGRKGKHRVKGYTKRVRGRRVRVKGHLSREEAPRRRRRKRRRARAAEAPRKRRRKGRRKARRRARENYAMAPRRRRRGRRRGRRFAGANPVSFGSLVVGLGVGTLGYLGADALDRFLATREGAALATVPEAAAARTDVPIYRDLPRLGAGVAVAAAPIVISAFIGQGTFRDMLQYFGFGAAMSTLGKAANGAIAYLLKDNNYGMRLYGTVRAADQLQSQALAGLPVPYGTSGLPLWLEGLGSCCRGGASMEQHKLQPPGGGLPPNVREQQYPPVSTPPQVPTYPQAPPPPPPVIARQPQPVPPTITVPGTPPFAPPTTVTGPGPAAAVPSTTPLPALPPVAAFFPSVGPAGFPSLRGLGADVKRQLQPALDAISANRDAFAAVQAGSATPEQHARAMEITQHFAPQLRTLQGLSGLGSNGGQRRGNPYRWGQDKNDDAAE